MGKKKELSKNDIDKIVTKKLINGFNQYIKRLSSMVYIDSDGMFYLKGENPKMERIGMFYGDENDDIIDLFGCCMYNTLEMFEFKKLYRYSTSTVEIGEDVIHLGQNPKAVYPEAKIDVNIISTREEKVIEETRNLIKKEFYRRFIDILDTEGIEPNDLDILQMKCLSDEQMDELSDSKMVIVQDNDCYAYITRAIFPNIGYSDKIEYVCLTHRGELDDKCAYFIFKEDIKDIDCYIFTIIAAYQSV